MQPKRRLCLAASATLPLSIMLDGCATVGTSGASVNAIVDASYSGERGATLDGMPTYKALGQALNAAPSSASQPWRIALRKGRYHEKLEITKPNIHLIGESRDTTTLTFDAYAGQTRPGSAATWATAGCATLTVRAPGFAAANVSIENGFDYLANDGKPATDPTRTNDPQGVALMTATGSDRARFDNVRIFGHQDTLFVDAGRNYFKNCHISGGVDFIFGASQTVFEACAIISRPRNKPNIYPIGYVTAPSTQIRDKYGLVFLRCKLLKESALVPANSTALGRPWHPAVNMPDGRYADPTAIGSSVFIECFMDDHITSDAWFSMTGLQKSGPDRTVFLPEDSRFFEYKSTGPGSKINDKRRQLTDTQAAEYTVVKVLGDWRL
jgi:pectinesterase